MADAEIFQFGSRGAAGRGRRTTSPAAASPVGSDPMESEATESEPMVSEPVEPEAMKPGPMEPEPMRPEPMRPDPFEPEPLEPEPPLTAGEEPAGEHKVPELSGIFADLTDLAARVIASLGRVPLAPVGDFARDPVRGLMGIAATLGVRWPGSLDELAEYARSRLSGDYAVDEFGFDPEFTTRIFLPLLRPLVQNWFRTEVRGVENLPLTGSALLVSNHAGTLPLDGMVLHTVVYDEIGRHVRMLGADLIFRTPFSHDFARRTGTTLACQEDAERLLASDQLVAVYPEGFKGLGKPYRDRYKLQRFGRGGFVSAAVRAQVPITPVSIVGSEEIYPLIAAAPGLARAMGVPYFPVTPLFPWLGVLGLVPLPSKWIIEFGEAIATDELPPGAAEDPMMVFDVTDQVRETIQHTLYALLLQRRSTFR